MANGGRIDYTIGFKTDKAGLNELKTQLNELSRITATDILNLKPNLNMNQARSEMMKLREAVSEVETAMNSAFDTELGVLNIQKLQTNLKRLNLTEIQQRFSSAGATGQKAFLNISKAALTTNVQLKQTSKILDKMGETLVNTIKWNISSKAINSFTGAIQQAYGYVQHLDSSLNDIRIVTNKSAEDMAEFAVQANKAAKTLGQSTTNYTEASLIYYQQGLSDEEVAARAETTLKAANVTGQSASQVSEELTAVWNGFQIQAENTEAAVDKLAAVAATTASDLEELSVGMSKVASTANAMGVDIDQLNAQISTIISVTRQAPESVGTALKTIYARMGDLKLGGEDEFGIKLGDVSGTLDKVGISVLDTNGNLREMGDVIEDVAAKWSTWTEAQQIAIAEIMAGKRQYNNLIALFDNWDKYTSALETSKNATGTLQHQQDIYMESTEAHLQQLKTQWEDLYDSILDPEAINTVADGLNKILTLITRIVDSLGGGKTLLFGLISLITTKFSKQISSIFVPFISNMKAAQQNAAILQTILKNIDEQEKAGDFGSKAAQAMREKQTEFSKFWHLMSEEEINASNELVKELGYWADLKEEIEQSEQALLKYSTNRSQTLNKGTQGKTFFANSEGKEQVSQTTVNETKKQLLKDEENTVIKLKNAYSSLETTVLKYNKKSVEERKKDKKSIGELENSYKELKEAVGQASDLAKKDVGIFSEDQIDKANKILKDLENRIEQLKNGKTRGGITSSLRKELQELLESFGLADERIKQFIDGLDKLPTESEKVKQGIITIEQATDTSLLAIQNRIQGITQIIGSLSGLMFGIQAFTNIPEIISNDELSNLEKVKQIFSNILIQLPMLISSFSSLSQGLQKLGVTSIFITDVEKKKILVDEKETAGIWAKAAAYMGLNVAMAPVIAAMAALAVVAVGVGVALKAHQKALERQAEVDTQAAEKAKEHADALKEQKENVEELSKSYKELQDQIDKHEISINDARQQIYDLCKQYGLQDLAVKTLTADYEELGDIISETQKKANDAYEEGLEDLQEKQLQALKSNIWAEAKGSQRDMVNGEQTIDLYGLGGSNTGLLEGKRKKLKTDLQELGISIDNDGHANLEDLIRVAATNEEALYKILNQYNIKASNQIREILKDNTEEIKAYGETIDSILESDRIDIVETIIPDMNTIDSVKDLEDAKEELRKSTLRDTFASEEEMNQWINDYFDGIDSIKEYIQKSEIGKALLDESSFSENQIYDFLEKANDEQIQFLSNNIHLADNYEKIEDFFTDFNQVSKRNNRQGATLSVEVALENTDGSKFEPEDIQNMFDNEQFTIDIGISQEEFEGMTYDQQTGKLLEYYLKQNQLENDFQQNQKQGIQENLEARKNAINEELEYYEQAKEQSIEGLHLGEYSEEDLGLGNTEFIENRKGILEDALKETEGFSDNLADAEEAIRHFLYAKEDLTEGELDYISVLQNKHGMSTEDIQLIYNQIKANEKYTDILNQDKKEIKKYNKAISSLTEQMDELTNMSSELNDFEMDWADFGKGVKQALSDTNQGIDDLQSAYSSLTSIMEEYNETGTLSLDNLQTFLNMDTAYLSALQIENGQMTLNEEALKQIALARLDEAEAEAYEQAMSELNDQQRRSEIEGIGAHNQSLVMLGNTAVSAGEAARQGAAGWREYWNAALNKQGVANDAYAQQVGQALYTKLQAIDSVRQQILSGGLGASIKGSSGSGKSGSGSAKEPDQEDFVNYEADIYHKVNAELDDIEEKLGRIQTIGDHTWGKSQVDVLNQEKKLLDENIDKLEEKIDLQKKDLSVRKKQLENEGFTFSDDSAVILNREEQIKALWDGYDAMVAQYNAMSASAQESYKATLEAEKDRVQQIADALDKYEDVYGEYQNALDDWLDKQYEIIETQIEAFNAEVEVKLTLNQAERDWIDFKKEVLDDIDDLDFGGRIAASLATLGTLLGPSGEISMMMNHLNESVYEIGESMQGIETNFTHDGVFDTAAAKEQLEDYRDKLMEAVRTAKEQVDEVADTYLDALDDANEKIQKQIEGWENIGDQIEHDINLIKKISGEKSYAALDRLYKQQHENNLETIQADKDAADFWAKRIEIEKKALETAEEGSVEWKTHNKALEDASKNYKSAIQTLNSTVIDALDNLEEWQNNQMAAIEQQLDQAFSGGIGLEQLEKEWNLVNDVANRYLDNVERAIEMDDLDTLFDKALNQANLTVSAQEEINKLRDEEFGKLEDREKISQYDIDLAKSRLAILQQQIALEDVQKNKSNLRLRRDSQGNYTYQYTGDDSQIDDAENGLMSAKKDWYELVKNRNLDLRNEIIKNRQDLSKAIMELNNTDWTNNEEGRKKQLEIIALYEQKEKDLMWDTQNTTRDFFEGTAKYFEEVENRDILPQWETTVNQLVNNWRGEGEKSFTGAVTLGIQEIESTQNEFVRKTQEVLNNAGISYINLYTNGIDPTKTKLEGLVDKNEDFEQGLDETNSKLDDYAEKLKDVEQGYKDLEEAASSAIQSANRMLEQLANTAVDAVNQINNAIQSANSAAAFQGYSSSSPSTSGGGGYGGSGSWTSTGYKGNINTGKRTGLYINWPSTGEPIPFYRINNGDPVYITNDTQFNYLKDHVFPMYEEYGKKYKNKKLEKKYKSLNSWTLRSGGYTGTWAGSSLADDYKSGRFALLHQKELVLNETDTKNILNAVAAIRDIDMNKYSSGILDTVVSQISSLLNTTSDLFNKVRTVENNTNTSNSYSGDVVINADFSGVKSADAIYEALVELENYGIQTMYANI